MKNIDKIRQMNSDELAEVISSDCLYCNYRYMGCSYRCECKQGIKQWLEQEVEE